MATILVVDDQPLNRQFLTALMKYAGHCPIEAADGAEALEKALDERPDLVITDILMPNMDGVEFTQIVRAHVELIHVPVLFYTATYRVEEARQLARSCGASMVLAKPSAPEKILAAVHEFLVLPVPQPEPALRGLPADPPHLPDLRNLTLRMSALIEEALPAEPEGTLPLSAAELLRHRTQGLQRLCLRLGNLVEMGVDLAGQRDIEEFLRRLCHAARNLGTSRYAVLGVLGKGGELQLFTKGMWSEEADLFRGQDPRAGVLGRLLEEGRPLRLRGGVQELGLPPAHPPFSSFLGVPFATPTRVFGWLYLADRLGAEEFSEEDEQLISTLAIQAGMVYDNLLLCEEVQLLHEESRRTAAQLQLEVKAHRRSEEIARTNQERLQHLAAAIPAMFYSLRVQAELFEPTWVSENVAQLTGWTPAEALAPNWWFEHLCAEDWVQALAGWEALVARGQGIREYRFQRRDGTYLWLRDTGRVLRDQGGNPVEVVGAWTDISEYKWQEAQGRALQRVREQVGRMRAPADFEQVLERVKEELELLGLSFQAWGIGKLRELAAGLYPQGDHHISAESRAVEALLRLWREGEPLPCPGLERSEFSENEIDFLGELSGALAEGFRRLDELERLSRIEVQLRQAGFESLLSSAPEVTGGGGRATASLTAPRCAATVLLVEDEVVLRELLAAILREEGYRVLEAAHGEEALHLAAQHQGEIHLLVTDMMMPGIGGRELAEQLLTVRPELKVVYMSGHPEGFFELPEVLQERPAFLQKPFKFSALLLKVRQALGKQPSP